MTRKKRSWKHPWDATVAYAGGKTRFKKFRTFGGKRYRRHDNYTGKWDAQRNARGWRKRGYLVRVVKGHVNPFDRRTRIYWMFLRKKSRR